MIPFVQSHVREEEGKENLASVQYPNTCVLIHTSVWVSYRD